MAGGYALAGRGPRRAVVAVRAVAATGILLWPAAASAIGGHLAITDPRGAWVAVPCARPWRC